MGEQNYRTEVNAGDFFGNQKKRAEMADRRPAFRKSTDIPGLGPGIKNSAVRISDFNNVLALCNGYFSALTGAANAPNGTEDFVGFVTMDDELGGFQTFRGMTSGTQFVRMVHRNPSDPDDIAWGAWV